MTGNNPAAPAAPSSAAFGAATDRLSLAVADRYRIERHLGAGGMATVYLAHDLKHDRKVAIKVLKPELAAVLGAERFVAEIKTTAALQHPHILPLFDSGSADGFLYYVMPYVEGETLRDKLNRETQLGVDEAIRIAREVADALDYAHRRGVIHRDIKPENILLHDGRPVVADFGIALAVSAAAGGRMTETGLSLGTPHYMSPEQATADKAITARSDIYSLGSVLYEMLAGDPPHTGSSAQQIIMKIIAEPAVAVTKYRKAVPPNVAAAVAQALEKLPADRFESAKAFAGALGNPGFDAATVAISAAAGGGSAGVPRWAFASAAVIAVAALGAAAWGWMRPAPAAPVSRFNIVLPDSQALSPNDPVTRFTVSPDGRTIAYVGYDARRNSRWQIYLRRLDRLSVEPVPGTEDAMNPAFSPDGKRIAFVSGTSRTLRVVSLAGGPPQVLTDSLVDLGGVAWGTDGYIYYDGHLAGDGLARIRETGGTPEIATRPADPTESWHSAPSALPNGRGVLFIIAHDRGASPSDIGVLDTRTGKYRLLVRGMAPRYVAPGYLLYVIEGGTVMATRFDAEQLTVSGDPVPIVAGVAASLRGGVDLEPVPNGTLIYAAGTSAERSRELVRVTRDGQVSRIDSTWKVDARNAAFSPDGGSVAVTVLRHAGSPEVWVKPLGAGPAVKIADAGGAAAWSPDGRTLAFSANGGLLLGPSDGSALPRVRRQGTPLFTGLEYSRDGQWLVGTVSGDIVAFRMSGDSALVPLVRTPALERRGTVSPDGRWLAYESDESGRLEIYVRPFPDVQTAKRQISFASGSNPRWSRDGRELFYITERLELVSVPVTLGATFSAGTPRALFSVGFARPPAPFDLEPDGKHFVMLGRAVASVDAPDQIVVVEHFDRELSARLPR